MKCKLLFSNRFEKPKVRWQKIKNITANVKALAKKGILEHKCSTLAPKFHRSTKVQFITSSPFFANAMLYAVVGNLKEIKL